MTTIGRVSSGVRVTLAGVLLALVGGVMSGVGVMVLGPVMGLTMGYFWGGAVLVVVLALGLCPLERRLDDGLVIGVTWAMLAMQWLIAGARVGYGGVVLGAIVVLGMQWMTVGLARLVHGVGGRRGGRWPAGLAKGISGLVVVMFLLSPIWMGMTLLRWSPAWTAALVQVHPLMVMEAMLPSLGYWTQSQIAYAYLTNLGQDIAYAPAGTVAWCLLLHGAVGAPGFMCGGRATSRGVDAAG